MPRNEQVTRQWHLLRLLESSRGITLDDITDRLPTDYLRHPRTVRRDLEALEAAGFPILNERRDGRVRWRLMDGFRHVPALSFSPTELMALVMSRALLKPLAGTQIQAALESAMTKASGLLPPHRSTMSSTFKACLRLGWTTQNLSTAPGNHRPAYAGNR